MKFKIGDKVVFFKDEYTSNRFGFDGEEMENALDRGLVLEVTRIWNANVIFCSHPEFTVDYEFDSRDLKLAEEEIETDNLMTLKDLFDKHGQIKVARRETPHIHEYTIIGYSVNFPNDMVVEYPDDDIVKAYNKVNTMVPYEEPPKTFKDMKTFDEKREYIRDRLENTVDTLFKDEQQKVTNVFMDLLDELES